MDQTVRKISAEDINPRHNLRGERAFISAILPLLSLHFSRLGIERPLFQ